MTSEAARAFVVVHAALAILATLAMLAAAALLYIRRAWFGRAAILAVVTLALAFASGMRLDPPYRSFARQRLFVTSPALGWLFERKFHASVAALGLAVVAAAAFAAAAKLPADAAPDARRAARLATLAAAAFTVFATLASAAVAPHLVFR